MNKLVSLLDDKRFWILMLVFWFLNVCDLYLTHAAMHLGATELNPIASYFIGDVKLGLFKIAMIGIVSLVLVILYAWENKKAALGLLVAFNLFFVGVVTNNSLVVYCKVMKVVVYESF